MKLLSCAVLIVLAAIVSGCGKGHGCDLLTRSQALELAREQKAGMLQRSTREYAANFASDAPAFVKLGAETNGYVANVGFKGRDGQTLVALIEGDCYVGWTYR
jgi:hypothetical protein